MRPLFLFLGFLHGEQEWRKEEEGKWIRYSSRSFRQTYLAWCVDRRAQYSLFWHQCTFLSVTHNLITTSGFGAVPFPARALPSCAHLPHWGSGNVRCLFVVALLCPQISIWRYSAALQRGCAAGAYEYIPTITETFI